MQHKPLSRWVASNCRAFNQCQGPWAHSEGDPRCHVAAAPNNLICILRFTAVNQHISVGAHTERCSTIRRHRQQLNFPSVSSMLKDADEGILHCVDNLKSSLWISELFSCTCSLFFSRNPAITDTLLTVQDSSPNPTAIKAHIKIKTVCSAMVLLCSQVTNTWVRFLIMTTN